MKKISGLLFGTPGIPQSTNPYNTIEGVLQVKKLGLSAMELEFVHSVNVSPEKAPLVKETAQKNGVTLTCHGQYYINLNALDKKKLEASKKRVVLAATRAFECGGWSMCFHPAYYLGMGPKKVFQTVKIALSEASKELKDNGINIWLRPETAGKHVQFGSIEELCELSLEIENVQPCIDFSHLYARSNGKLNTFDDFSQVLAQVEKMLGKEAIENMHIHAQGIQFTEKGERKHLPFNESKFNYRELLKALKEFRAKGVIICESPLVEEDTLVLQKAFNEIK